MRTPSTGHPAPPHGLLRQRWPVWIGRGRWAPLHRRLGTDEAAAVLERYERHCGQPATK